LNGLISKHAKNSYDEVEICQIRTHETQSIVEGKDVEDTLPLALWAYGNYVEIQEKETVCETIEDTQEGNNWFGKEDLQSITGNEIHLFRSIQTALPLSDFLRKWISGSGLCNNYGGLGFRQTGKHHSESYTDDDTKISTFS
jgi:hypothetical protein